MQGRGAPNSHSWLRHCVCHSCVATTRELQLQLQRTYKFVSNTQSATGFAIQTTGISILSIFSSRTALSCRLAKAAAGVATYPVTGPAMACCIANARGIRRRRGLEKMAGQYYGQTLATVTLTLTCSATYKINKNEDSNFRSHLRNRQLGTAFRATDIL